MSNKDTQLIVEEIIHSQNPGFSGFRTLEDVQNGTINDGQRIVPYEEFLEMNKEKLKEIATV